MISALPAKVRLDASALIILIGLPDRAVKWSITGAGALAIITDRTDSSGRAYCRYNPASTGTVTVSATYAA